MTALPPVATVVRYDTYVDIAPIIGTTFRAYKRLQINVRVLPVEGLNDFESIRSVCTVWCCRRVVLSRRDAACVRMCDMQRVCRGETRVGEDRASEGCVITVTKPTKN